MKLATWNLARPNTIGRRQALRERINKIGADVWVFTETHGDLARDFPFSCSSAAGRDGIPGLDTPGDLWVTISSTYRIEPLPTADKIRTAAARVFPNEGAPFIVYGLVLPWLGDQWRGHSSAGGIAFREALEVQLSDWKKLRREYPDDEFFLLGDFNQDLASSHYYGSQINRLGLIAALDACGLVALTGGENDPIRRASAPCACIDHICALSASNWTPLPGIRWPDAPKPVKKLSDHFGTAISFVHDDAH